MSTDQAGGDRAPEDEDASDGEFDQGAGVDRARSIVVAMAVAGGAALIAAVALRSLGRVAVPEGVSATAAHYGPVPVALFSLLMAALSGRPEAGSAIAPGPDADRRFAAFLRYQAASGRGCVFLVAGSMAESAAYWYTGDPAPAALAVVLLAALTWRFPTRDRMGRAIEDATA